VNTEACHGRSTAEVLKNPSVSVVLSFFITGLGQIYNGQIAKGIMLLVLMAISLGLMLAVIGWITTPILWVFGMIDAYNSARKINDKLAAE
jgi:TM2 domain-containing membrane protein YozV